MKAESRPEHELRKESSLTEPPTGSFANRPDPDIARQVGEFLDAPTWEAKKALANANLDVLSSADARLAMDFLADLERDDPGLLADLHNQRGLIEACVLEGVDAAFESWLHRFPEVPWIAQHILEVLIDFILAPTWLQSKHIVQMHPFLSHEVVDGFLEQIQVHYCDNEDDAAFAEVVARDQALLVACRKDGIESAFAEHIVLIEQFHALLTAQSEDAKRAVLDQHAELLNDEARLALDGFLRKAEKRGDTEMASTLLWHTEWLDAQRRSALEDRLGFRLTMASAIVQRSIQAFATNQDGSGSSLPYTFC